MVACNDDIEIETRRNNLQGTTKRVIDRVSHYALDSIFDASGNLKEIDEYYFENEMRKKKISYYKEGIQDSVMLEFYYSGKVKSKKFYFSGKECFERIDFNEEGRISKYVFLNSDQTKFYVRLYDSSGNCIGIRGTPFFESYMYGNSDYVFSTDDTVKTFFYAPNPPDCYVKLYTKYNDKEINNIYPLPTGFIYIVKLYPLTKGNYEWDVKMKIFDKKDDSLIYSSELNTITYKVK
jgi:hypothetical protein